MSESSRCSGLSLEGKSFKANDWSTDEYNGADWELFVDGWQYVFQDIDGKMNFIGLWDPRDEFYGHSQLHGNVIPDELLDLFTGSALTPMSNGVPVEGDTAIEMQGRVEAASGASMLVVDNPANPQQTWKNAENVIRQLCMGHVQLDLSAEVRTYPRLTVKKSESTVTVSLKSSDVEHVFHYERVQGEDTVCPTEMVQQGELYRTFDVPELVERVVGAEGFVIEEV
jgi:hypothetical protein